MVHEPRVNSVSAADKGSIVILCLVTRQDANGRTADRIRLYGPREVRSTWRRLSQHINANRSEVASKQVPERSAGSAPA